MEKDLQHSKSFEALKKEFDPKRLAEKAAREAAEDWSGAQQDLTAVGLNSPEMDLPKLSEITNQIESEYASFKIDYEIMRQIQKQDKKSKENGLALALSIYQTKNKNLDQYLFNYVAAYISDCMKPILADYNRRMHYAHVSLFISTAHKSIAFVIYDPQRYFKFYSDNTIVEHYLEANAQSDKKIRIIDLAISHSQLKSYIGFKVNVELKNEFENKKQQQRILSEASAKEAKKLYDMTFNTPLAKFKHTFMRKQFLDNIEHLKQKSSKYYSALEKYEAYQNQLANINKSLGEFSKQQDLFNHIRNDGKLINDELLVIYLAE